MQWKTFFSLRIFILLVLLLGFFKVTTGNVFAHEQYVLTKEQFAVGMADHSLSVFSALQNRENLKTSIFVAIGITIAGLLYFLFQYTTFGQSFSKWIEKFDSVSHLLLRVALSGSFLASAYFHSFLGPEIPQTSIPYGQLFSPVLYVLGILLFFGVFTKVVAFVGLILLFLTTSIYGVYMLTYVNYYGELLALCIFGSYAYSLDNRFFGIAKLVTTKKDLELLLIRVTYGISVMYPAITVKFLHPMVIVEIVKIYHLNQISWLFPSDPLLIALGTGAAQVLVGMLIIIGFETRLASLATFFLYLMSVMYFKEAVWPHYVLLALAFYLVINNGGKLTLDTAISNLFYKKTGKKK